jgi:hypothetical protein
MELRGLVPGLNIVIYSLHSMICILPHSDQSACPLTGLTEDHITLVGFVVIYGQPYTGLVFSCIYTISFIQSTYSKSSPLKRSTIQGWTEIENRMKSHVLPNPTFIGNCSVSNEVIFSGISCAYSDITI